MSEDNVNILRQGYDAFNRADIDTVMGLMDPEIEWQEPDVEGLPQRGTHHGPQDVANNVFGPIVGNWDNFQAVPDEFLDAGERVVVLGHFEGTGKATGRTLPTPTCGPCAMGRRCISAPTRTQPTFYNHSVKSLSAGAGVLPGSPCLYFALFTRVRRRKFLRSLDTS